MRKRHQIPTILRRSPRLNLNCKDQDQTNQADEHPSIGNSMVGVEPFLSGIFGALGSVAGKFALSADSPINNVCLNEVGKALLNVPHSTCTIIIVTFRVMLFLVMLGCNGLMLSNFLMALEKRGTLTVVIISSTCNMLASGMLGYLLFGESLRESWIFGASLMLIGVFLVAHSQQDTKKIPG